MTHSSRKAVYAVMGFSPSKGGASIDPPKPAKDEADALRLAERLADSKVGVLAFYRVGDPDIGEFDQPVVIGQFGRIPFDIDQIFAAG